MKKGILKKIVKFEGKHLCWSFFFNSCKPAALLKKRLIHGCFPVSFVKYLRTPFDRTPPGDCFWLMVLVFIWFYV